MVENPIRRGQLIAPFGVGAMVVGKNGTAMVTAALDYWYRRDDGRTPSTESLREFRVEEWRLQRRLGISHFRLPPDWRESEAGQGVPNPYLPVPFLKFPTWYSCRKCGLMHRSAATDRKTPECASCKARGWYGRMVQVPIVAVCRRGHLMEFPWREWVHRSHVPSCQQSMRLVSLGGATLAAKVIKCACGKERSLSGVTSADSEGMTTVTRDLTEGGAPFLCRGERAWAGGEEDLQECNVPVQGSLRNATNVYYADVQSAIFLPIGSGSVPAELMEAIEDRARRLLGNFNGMELPEDVILAQVVRLLLQDLPSLEATYDRDVLTRAVRHILHPEEDAAGAEQQFEDEVVFRHEEHRALQSDRMRGELLTRVQRLEDYGRVGEYLSCVSLVEKLKETRVLNGFTRVDPPPSDDFNARQQLMWLHAPPAGERWLPAQVVYGEGIYLALDEGKLSAWEDLPHVRARIARLADTHPGLTPRAVLLHTLSHLLMNQLTFSCGYSSATLRERLYVSLEEKTRMAGILIYTAEGDADGTLGGLVRMGKAQNFSAVFEQALANAMWCSADPVCMEAGEKGGQGPGSQNLAACHSCALVPETACELFNRYLDRGLVVGTPEHPELGFFSPLVAPGVP